jgi:hypothetical protein
MKIRYIYFFIKGKKLKFGDEENIKRLNFYTSYEEALRDNGVTDWEAKEQFMNRDMILHGFWGWGDGDEDKRHDEMIRRIPMDKFNTLLKTFTEELMK